MEVSHYGLDRIISTAKSLRSLDPKVMSLFCYLGKTSGLLGQPLSICTTIWKSVVFACKIIWKSVVLHRKII